MDSTTEDDGLTPDQRAERDASKVTTDDQVAREEAGEPEPAEGHDVRDHVRTVREDGTVNKPWIDGRYEDEQQE